jgi:hypothetical protein
MTLVCKGNSGTIERMFGDAMREIMRDRRALDAAEAAWLSKVASYDRSGEWRVDGFGSAASAKRVIFERSPYVLMPGRRKDGLERSRDQRPPEGHADELSISEVQDDGSEHPVMDGKYHKSN